MTEWKGSIFVTTLVLELKIQSDDGALYSSSYWQSKTETTVNESGINNVFK